MVDGLPVYRNILLAPILHYRLELADAVRAMIEAWRPEAIVVELPATLEPQVIRAVDRLPELSIVLYLDRDNEPVYLPVEPCDALLEAVRSGRERNIPVIFGDLDVDEFPLYDEPFPDTYTVHRLGWAALWREYQRANPRPERSEQDQLRERSLAWHLQTTAAEHDRVLGVCGMAHVAGILAALESPQAQPLGKVSRERVQVFNLHPDSARQVTATMPFVGSLYELRRRELPPVPEAAPPVVREHESGLRLISSGTETEAQQTARRERLRARLARECGADPADPFSPLDRQKAQLALCRAAVEAYEAHTGEEFKPADLRTWQVFDRNWAILDGRLLPDLYQLIVGARGVADDNLAHEVWDLGSEWPWQQESGELPTVRMSPEEIWLGSRRFALRPRVQRSKRRLHPIRLKERQHERRPGEWREQFARGWGICSYPPEDIVIEEFGEFLKRRAKRQLAEDDAKVEKFSTSLLDGVDVRETLRNWHEGSLYVKELRRIRGEVGSVVVIFDEDEADERYPWKMTWLGEHEQESDMAFYATPADRQIVGPGIARCEYGGLMMSYPPGRMMDVWVDPDYQWVAKKSERLLLAALDYNEQRHVVYVAAKPPRSVFRTWAGRLGQQIVYLPIGGFSPPTLKKLRVFHVLSGHDKRAIAKDYLW